MRKEIDDEDLGEMLKFYNEGVSIEQLSQEYAYPKSDIYRTFARHGIKFHTGQRSLLETMDSNDVTNMVAEYNEWVPIRALVDKYDLHNAGNLFNILRTLGVPFRTQTKDYLIMKTTLLDEAISMYEKGYPIWQICETCEVDSAKLYNEIHHRGMKVGRLRGGGSGNKYTG